MALTACGDDIADQVGSPAPSPAGDLPSIDCTAYYRPHGDASTEGAVEQSVVLGPGSGATSERSIEFETMSFVVSSFSDGAEADSVSVAVETADGIVLTSVLYQLGSFDLADVEFVGGHGFTGLHYVNHLGAQLQFWCSAE